MLTTNNESKSVISFITDIDLVLFLYFMKSQYLKRCSKVELCFGFSSLFILCFFYVPVLICRPAAFLNVKKKRNPHNCDIKD